MSFVDFFPTEMVEMVFSHLSVPDLVNSSLVCVSWYEASNKSSVWREAIKRSTPKDRFRKLSDLDRFTGIASNYDENHCFQVDRQSPCNLSPMNPWKLSLFQNNFLLSNWRGKHNTILARHQIKFEDSMVIDEKIRIVYPSKSPQDRLYLPIIRKKVDQPEKDFLLIRLDGTPRISQKILSTESEIPIICIDRDCVVWVQDEQVKYLSPVENNDSSQIENLGMLTKSVDGHEIARSYYMMTMNDKYIVAGFRMTLVKIWCKKTKQLKLTREGKQTISNVNCVIAACYLFDERIYFYHEKIPYDGNYRFFLEIYDIKKDKFVDPLPCLEIVDIAFSDKYYAVYEFNLEGFDRCIIVREIETDEVKFSVRVDPDGYFPKRVWIVDDKVLNIEVSDESSRLEILSLVDQNYSNEFYFCDHESHSACIYYVWDSLLLVKNGNLVSIWDWKQEKKHRELLLLLDKPSSDKKYTEYLSLFYYDEPYSEDSSFFYNDETRLVIVSNKYVNIIGFW